MYYVGTAGMFLSWELERRSLGLRWPPHWAKQIHRALQSIQFDALFFAPGLRDCQSLNSVPGRIFRFYICNMSGCQKVIDIFQKEWLVL